MRQLMTSKEASLGKRGAEMQQPFALHEDVWDQAYAA